MFSSVPSPGGIVRRNPDAGKSHFRGQEPAAGEVRGRPWKSWRRVTSRSELLSVPLLRAGESAHGPRGRERQLLFQRERSVPGEARRGSFSPPCSPTLPGGRRGGLARVRENGVRHGRF